MVGFLPLFPQKHAERHWPSASLKLCADMQAFLRFGCKSLLLMWVQLNKCQMLIEHTKRQIHTVITDDQSHRCCTVHVTCYGSSRRCPTLSVACKTTCTPVGARAITFKNLGQINHAVQVQHIEAHTHICIQQCPHCDPGSHRHSSIGQSNRNCVRHSPTRACCCQTSNKTANCTQQHAMYGLQQFATVDPGFIMSPGPTQK